MAKERIRSRMKVFLACVMCMLLLIVSTGITTAFAEGEPVLIRWYQESRGLDPASDRVLQTIQQKFNIEFEFIEPPADGSNERLNLLVSTGEQMDLITSFSVDQVAYQWAEDDFIYSWDELMEGKDYPLIRKLLDAEVFESLKVNGKSYFKPQPLVPGNRGYVINKDWLDKVGLDIPTTIDEFYEVIKAFKEDDPDGNGVDDTYGFYVAEPIGSNAFGYICRAFIDCDVWGGTWVETADGGVTQFAVSEEAKEAFRFIKKCYDEDLFNKNFVNEIDAVGKVEDLLVQQRIGITDLSQPQTVLTKMEEAGVELNLVYLPPLTKTNGEPGTLPHSGGYWSFHMIPRTCSNPDVILDLLEWALTEEGRELTMFGLEGVHYNGYTQVGNNRVYDINEEEMEKDWSTSDYGFIHPMSWGAFNYCENTYIPLEDYDTFDEAYANLERWGDFDPTGTLLETWFNDNAQYAKLHPLQGVIAQEVQVPQTLQDIEISGRTKAIVEPAEDFDKNWDEFVELWLNQGGAELIEAANEYLSEHAQE